jgi:hypothetical protein
LSISGGTTPAVDSEHNIQDSQQRDRLSRSHMQYGTAHGIAAGSTLNDPHGKE